MSLGQFDTDKTILLSTRLNKFLTGVSDVVIDIYNPSGDKVVNAKAMAELASTGIYQFSYTIPSDEGTYTIFINSSSQRDYKELQTFTASAGFISAGAIADAVWDETTSDHVANGTFGKKMQTIGGGLALTADMVILLKRLSDNVIRKKEFKKFIEKLTSTVSDMKSSIGREEEQSKQKMSKMEANVEDKINILLKQNKTKEITKLFKDSFKQFNLELNDNQEKLSNLIEVNEISANILQKMPINELNSTINGTSQGVNNLQNFIEGMNNNVSNNFNRLSSDVLNMSKVYTEKVSKFKENLNIELKSVAKEVNNINKRFQKLPEVIKLSEKTSQLHKDLFNNEKLLNILKDNSSEINSFLKNINLDVTSLTQLTTQLNLLNKSLEDLKSESLMRGDLNLISDEIKDAVTNLQSKIGNINQTIQTETKKISSQVKRDDLPEVMAQIDMMRKAKT